MFTYCPAFILIGKENIIKILIIFCFIINIFVPKIIVSPDIQDTLSDIIKCQSGVLYFASISTLSLGLLNDLLAVKLGLTDLKRAPAETKSKKQKNTSNASSCDYTLVSAQGNMLTRTNIPRFISPLYGDFNIVNIGQEYMLLERIDFQLHILCLLVLCLFFMLPRGSIDNYAILTAKYKL